MRTLKSNHFYCLFILIFSSCGQLIDDTFDDFTPTPIMIGILQADSTFSIYVGITANLSDTLPKHANNAMVVITNDTNTPDTLHLTFNGNYISQRTVKAGETYTCTIKIDGFKTVLAQTTVPVPTEIESVNYTEKALRDENGNILSSIDFSINNNRLQHQFWEVEVESEGKFYDFNNNCNSTYTHYIEMFAGQDTVLLNEATPLTLFSDKSMTTSQYKVKFFFYKENMTNTNYLNDVIDSTFIVLKSVGKTYYDYVKQYYIYQTGKEYGFSFTSQHYPLYSNIKNGYGIFTSFSTCRYRYKFDEQ